MHSNGNPFIAQDGQHEEMEGRGPKDAMIRVDEGWIKRRKVFYDCKMVLT